MRGFQSFGANIDPREGACFFGAIPLLLVYTANGTWINPLAQGLPARLVTVIVVAGGGGGGQPIVGAGQYAYGGAGGSTGGAAKFTQLAAKLASSVTVTVGAGAASLGTYTINKPSNTGMTNIGDVAAKGGGNSAFGSYATCNGAGAASSYDYPGNPGTAALSGVTGETYNGALGGPGDSAVPEEGGSSSFGPGAGGSGGYAAGGVGQGTNPANGGNSGGAGGAAIGGDTFTGTLPSSSSPPYPDGSASASAGGAGSGALAAALAVGQANWTHWLAPCGGGGAGGAGIYTTWTYYCNATQLAGGGGNGGFAGGGGGGAGLCGTAGDPNNGTAFFTGGPAGAGAQGVVVVEVI